MNDKRVKVGRSEPCPCGSGKKYKACCYDKAFQYVQDAEGNIFREIPMNAEMKEAFQERLEQFRAEHGREPEPHERIFDGEPEHVEHRMVETMKKAGIRPAIIYAFEKTGRIVTEANRDLIPEAEVAEWVKFYEEYESRA